MKQIGIKLADGSFYPIMEDGIVAEKKVVLTTVKDNQTKVLVDLYRSKTGSMENAEYIDSLQIDNLVQHSSGEVDIPLDIALDENNKLSASINDPETGSESKATVTLVSRTLEERMEPAAYNVVDADSKIMDDDYEVEAVKGKDIIDESEINRPEIESVESSFEKPTQSDDISESDDFIGIDEVNKITIGDDAFGTELDESGVESDSLNDEILSSNEDELSADIAENSQISDENFNFDDFENIGGEDFSQTEQILKSENDFSEADSIEKESESESSPASEPVTDDFLIENPDEDVVDTVEEESVSSDETVALAASAGAVGVVGGGLLSMAMKKLQDEPSAGEKVGDDETESAMADEAAVIDETESAITGDTIISNESDELSVDDAADKLSINLEPSINAETDEFSVDKESDEFSMPESFELKDADLDSELKTDFSAEESVENEAESETNSAFEDSFDDQNGFELPDFSEIEDTSLNGFTDEKTSDVDLTEKSLKKLDDDNFFANDFSTDDLSLPDFNDETSFASESSESVSKPMDDFDDSFLESLDKKSESKDITPSSGINFDGLYDKETVDGESDVTNEEIRRKTRIPVVICIICAIICVIATLLVLFVFPSKYNLLSKTEKPSENSQIQQVEDTQAVSKNQSEIVPNEEPVVGPAPIEAKEEEIVLAPEPEKVIPEPPVEPPKKQKDTKYKIKWGDTLWDIADSYYKNPWRYKKIARYNKILNPDYIISGTVIMIPAE